MTYSIESAIEADVDVRVAEFRAKKFTDRAARSAAEFSIASEVLVEKFADRGLKFTQRFIGSYPVQAFGHLDGMRFYFRFRNNVGSLQVGPYVAEVEELYALRVNEDIVARRAANPDRWVEPLREAASGHEKDFFPHVVAKHADVFPVKGNDDGLSGELSGAEAFHLFSALVDSLEDVPADEQLSEFTKVWLYEGRDAVRKWEAEQQASELV